MGIEPTSVLCFGKMQRIKYLSVFGMLKGFDARNILNKRDL